MSENIIMKIMKIKLLLSILFSCIAISAMEDSNINNLNLNKILVKPASLKLNAAWRIANSPRPVPEDKVPAEILEYVNYLKLILSCRILSQDETKFLINIIDNPAINISQDFPLLVKKYRQMSGQDNKQKILNGILLDSTARDQLEIIKLILIFGADINAYKIIHNNLALFTSTSYRGLKTAIKMTNLAKRKNPNYSPSDNYNSNFKKYCLSHYGQTPLIRAAILGHEQLVKMLIEAGANVNAQDQEGCTALMWVLLIEIFNNTKVYYNEIANMLIEANANLSLQDIDGESSQDLITHYGITKKAIKYCCSNCILI